MPEDTSTGSKAIRLLPVVMPGAAAPVLGEWHGRGLCIGEDPDAFFPSHGDPGKEARRICGVCPVRDDCLEYAIEADEHGIWDGLDQDERRNLRTRQRRQAAAIPDRAIAEHGKAEGGGMTPEQRRLRAKIAANVRWSKPTARADQADAARAAIFARLERQVDPQGTLPPADRDELVQAAARALSARLRSAKVRERQRKASA